MTPAQHAQQNNRDDHGKYQAKAHSEAGTSLETDAGTLESHEVKGKRYLEHLQHEMNWPAEHVEYTEQIIATEGDYWGVHPGSTVRRLTFHHPHHRSSVEVEQITLPLELSECHGITEFQQTATLHNPDTDETQYDTMEYTYHDDHDLAGMTEQVKGMLARLNQS